jgi:isopentenyldiphosphate isomerase
MNGTYQLYDEQGRLAPSDYVSKDDIFKLGKLHGASHVWIWRVQNGVVEVLLQKRSPQKWTWPNCYDVSAAGHINAGEEPLTAGIRETKEEIGIDIDETHMQSIGVQRARLITPNGLIENEFQWLYLLRLDGDTVFTIEDNEVLSLVWKPFDDMIAEFKKKPDTYVPHGDIYFDTVLAAILAANK